MKFLLYGLRYFYCLSTLTVESQHKYSPLVYYIEAPHDEILWYSTHIVLVVSFCKTDKMCTFFLNRSPWGTSLSFIYKTP